MDLQSPLKTIRSYCLTCCCESVYEVRVCPATYCHLYPYRLGHDPRREYKPRGPLSPEDREILKERLARGRRPVGTKETRP